MSFHLIYLDNLLFVPQTHWIHDPGTSRIESRCLLLISTWILKVVSILYIPAEVSLGAFDFAFQLTKLCCGLMTKVGKIVLRRLNFPPRDIGERFHNNGFPASQYTVRVQPRYGEWRQSQANPPIVIGNILGLFSPLYPSFGPALKVPVECFTACLSEDPPSNEARSPLWYHFSLIPSLNFSFQPPAM